MNKSKCPKCGGSMGPGIAIAETATPGTPDFSGGEVVTMFPGGPGRIIGCVKCGGCGHSKTQGEPSVYLASRMRHDSPARFMASEDGRTIYDDDFIFDAKLRLSGDFGKGEKLAFALWIVGVLNEADAKLPREPEGAI